MFQGFRHHKQGDFATARNDYLQAVEQARKSSNLLQLPRALAALADDCSSVKNYGQAERHLREALAVYSNLLEQNSEDNNGLSGSRFAVQESKTKVNGQLAEVLFAEGKLDEAAATYKQILSGKTDLAVQEKYTKQYIEVLKKQGRSAEANRINAVFDASFMGKGVCEKEFKSATELFLIGEFDEAESRFESTIISARNLGDKDLLFKQLSWLAIRRCAQSDKEGVEKALKEAVAISGMDAQSVKQEIGNELYVVGNKLKTKETRKEKERLYKGAATLLESGSSVKYCQLLGTLGQMLNDEGRFQEAAKELDKSCECYEKLPKTDTASALPVVLSVKALNLAGMKKFDDAQRIGARAVEVSAKMFGGETNVDVEVLNRLAAVYGASKKFDKEAEIREKTISIFQRHPFDKPLYVAICTRLACTYVRLKKSKLATNCLEKGLQQAPPTEVPNILSKFAKCCYRVQDFDTAKPALQTALKGYKSLNHESTKDALEAQELLKKVLARTKENFAKDGDDS